MAKQPHSPAVKMNGLTFLPVPSFSDVNLAFGAPAAAYFSRHDQIDIPRKFRDEMSRLMFNGGAWPEFGADVDATAAKRAIKALLSSWAPAHEAKESTVAYALWVWSPEAADERAKAANKVAA